MKWPQTAQELAEMLEHCGNVMVDITVDGDDDNEVSDIACELQQLSERLNTIVMATA